MLATVNNEEVRTQVKVSADSAGTLQLELVLELFDAGAELVDLLDGDLRTQTAYVTHQYSLDRRTALEADGFTATSL